jgi:hypothetical protein
MDGITTMGMAAIMMMTVGCETPLLPTISMGLLTSEYGYLQ